MLCQNPAHRGTNVHEILFSYAIYFLQSPKKTIYVRNKHIWKYYLHTDFSDSKHKIDILSSQDTSNDDVLYNMKKNGDSKVFSF